MKGLLIVLTIVAIVAMVFSGGCSLVAVGSFVLSGPRGEYPGLQEGIAWISAGVGLLSAAVLAANVVVLSVLFRHPSPWRRVLGWLLGAVDVAAAVAALAWLDWADGWHGANWPWTWLAKAGAGLLVVKGVLIWRLVGCNTQGHADSPVTATRVT